MTNLLRRDLTDRYGDTIGEYFINTNDEIIITLKDTGVVIDYKDLSIDDLNILDTAIDMFEDGANDIRKNREVYEYNKFILTRKVYNVKEFDIVEPEIEEEPEILTRYCGAPAWFSDVYCVKYRGELFIASLSYDIENDENNKYSLIKINFIPDCLNDVDFIFDNFTEYEYQDIVISDETRHYSNAPCIYLNEIRDGLTANETLKHAQETLIEGVFDCELPDLNIGNIVKLDRLWDCDGNAPDSSFSIQLNDNDYINYCFHYILRDFENPENSFILITAIEII